MKPVGSTNAVDTTVNTPATDGDGFWMAVEEVTHVQVTSTEPDTLFDEPEEVLHMHIVSVKPDALLGKSEILEGSSAHKWRVWNYIYHGAP
jgi:hypothetical protein